MCRVIAVSNQKGGVGKTVSCVNLGIGLAQEGKKVLLIDADPQGSLTISLGYEEPDEMEYSLATLMMNIVNDEKLNIEKTILYHKEGVDLIPANIELSAIEVSLVNAMSRELILRSMVDRLREFYDYIIIDTQPTRDSLLLTNAINAADYVLIPSLCEANSQESAFRTYALCNELRNTPGSHLKGVGVILTMVVKKAATTKIIRDQCKQVLGASLYKTEIPSGLSVNMSVTKHLPVCYMAKTQPVAVAYGKAYEELKAQLAKMGVN